MSKQPIRMLIPVNAAPLAAAAIDGEVVIYSRGPGVPVSCAFTPEAVLASLEPMRTAAEHAIRLRTEPGFRSEDAEPHEP
jgi:hypothetical protein